MATSTELIAFPVKRGKESRAAEWMQMLSQRHAECIETLERESMHYECIFRTVIGGVTYLSWFSVQGQVGSSVHTSPFAVDQLHMQFWEECIDGTSPPVTFEHVVSFVPAEIHAAVEARDRRLCQGVA